MEEERFSIRARLKSFKYAFNGLGLLFNQEHNARVHVVGAVVALALSFYFQISNMEWVVILIAIALVFITELFNSAIEKLADVISPEYHPRIKIVKDLAAAAVLVAAVLALLIAGLIFIPKIY